MDEALGGERYRALLERLERFVRNPPLRDEPSEKKLRKRAKQQARGFEEV